MCGLYSIASKLSRPKFEFSLKEKVIGWNPVYIFLNLFLLYKDRRQEQNIAENNPTLKYQIKKVFSYLITMVAVSGEIPIAKR